MIERLEGSTWKPDLDAAGEIARRYLGTKSTSPAVLRRRWRADAVLLLELWANIGVTYALVYGPWPLWARVALLIPWSIYSALSVDNILHYANHWPLSRAPWANVLLRAMYLPLLLTPLEIRYVHWEHHKYNDIEVDQHTWMRSIAARARRPGVSVLLYAASEVLGSLKSSVPWAALPPFIERLRSSRPWHYAEIRAARWIGLLWLAALVAYKPVPTLALFVPAVVIVPLVASLLMNLTDHIPGTLTHPFRQATYLEPRTLGERFYAALNRQSAATHLTHHLFPQVHWTELRALQRELKPLYARHGAPESLLHTSVLVGNWIEVVRMYLRIAEACRRDLQRDDGATETRP